MARREFTIEEVLTMLQSAPARIKAATAGLTSRQSKAAPSAGEWSINEVLAHLRSCADVRGEVIYKMLSEDKPTFRAVDPRAWIKDTDYPQQDFQRSLRAYAARRARLMSTLMKLPRRSWSRSATVTGAGRPLTRTIFFYAQWVARHERPHLKQIERIAAAMRG